MKKYKLKHDLPWAKAGTEWVVTAQERSLDGGYLMRQVGNGFTDYQFPYSSFTEWFEEVKPERWRPTQGEKYFSVVSAGHLEAQKWAWHGDSSDRFLYGTSNCFRTREQAEEAARRVKETLMRYQDELTNQ